MGAIGAFTFVLHSHLPYVRGAGRWPHGEEWIHEAVVETYVPLLRSLYKLKDEGVNFRLTLGLTPVLAEQLHDPLIIENTLRYLDERIAAAQADQQRYRTTQTDSEPESQQSEYGHLYHLAEWYENWYSQVRTAFTEQFNRNLIGAFKQLQDEGYIELIGSAATHGYLPLLSREGTLRAQIRLGLETHERLFGHRPTSFWLPECAYRPAYVTEDGSTRPGLEYWLAKADIKVFFSETHTITGGQPVGAAAGGLVGPYGSVARRYVIPQAHEPLPRRIATTYRPYYVSDTLAGVDSQAHSGVVVIGRNNSTGQQVWSSEYGYPGDFDYREFHKKAGTSGLHYWRVTGDTVELDHKDYYHPDWAGFKIEQHAEHFAHLVGDLLREHYNNTGKYGVIASNYDTELFGHWWFEGVQWLEYVLRHLSDSHDIDLVTASEFVQAHPPGDNEALHIPESSWGAGGSHFNWDNADTHWMWEPIHKCEQRMERLANIAPDPDEIDDATWRVLQQAARELLLMQSSDWMFHVTSGQAREYAIQRFNQHVEHFEKLAASLEANQPDQALADALYEADHIFADIDYRHFRTP